MRLKEDFNRGEANFVCDFNFVLSPAWFSVHAKPQARRLLPAQHIIYDFIDCIIIFFFALAALCAMPL